MYWQTNHRWIMLHKKMNQVLFYLLLTNSFHGGFSIIVSYTWMAKTSSYVNHHGKVSGNIAICDYFSQGFLQGKDANL